MKAVPKFYFVIFFMLTAFHAFSKLKKDSLLASLTNRATHDTSRIDAYCGLVNIYSNDGNIDSSLISAKKAMELSVRINYQKGIGMAYNAFGRYYYERAEYKSSIENYELAIKIFKELGLKLKEAKAILGIAPNFSMLGDIKKSLNYNLNGLKILELLRDSIEVARAYNNIGNLYEKLDDATQAIYYFKKGIQLSKKIGNKKQLGTAYYNISRTLLALNKNAEADTNLYAAYIIFKDLNYKMGLSYVLQNMALSATEKDDFYKAKQFYHEGIELANEINDKNILAYSYGGLADVFMKEKKYSEVISQLQIAMPIANEVQDMELEISLYSKYSEAYYALGDYRKSIDNHILYSKLKDSLFKVNSSQEIAEMQAKYDAEKKDQENQLLTTKNNLSNETIQRQKITGYFIVAGLVLTLGLLFFIFKGLLNQKKANRIIESEKRETEKQTMLVEEKNKEITDSIVYASRIQKAMLTSETYIKRYFDNFFVLFKPKDIVSGDFYWAYHEGDKTYFVTADCTGHGVPGAMMSMLSINLLNEIICERKIEDPHQILNVMRKEIIKALNSEDSKEEGNDGLDCVILIFNHVTLNLQYACANNSFYILRNQELIQSKADKMPVGKSPRETEGFVLNEVQLQPDDLVVTLTDGFADQFGGPKGKKFKYKPLEQLLLSNKDLPLDELKDELNTTINSWRGNLEQVDDICIIGIKI